MNSYHISSDGVARKCQAQSPETCRAVSASDDSIEQDFQKQHYGTLEEAQAAYEQQQIKHNNGEVFSTVDKEQLFNNKLTEAEIDQTKHEIDEKIKDDKGLGKILFYDDYLYYEAEKTRVREKHEDKYDEYFYASREYIKAKIANKNNNTLIHLKTESNRLLKETLGIIHEELINKPDNNNARTYRNLIASYKTELTQEKDLVHKAKKEVIKENFINRFFNNTEGREAKEIIRQYDNRIDEIDEELKNIA